MKQKIDTVKFFLNDFFCTIKNSGIYIVPRQKNINGLKSLGVSKNEAIDEILDLTYNEYSSGPEKDENANGDIWIFGKIISGKLIYLKLKIDCLCGRKIAKCLSIHPAEFTMNFPLKGV